MKHSLILVNAYSNLAHGLNQSARLKEELEKLGVSTDIKRNDYFACSINDEGNTVSKAKDYDFCIYLDKDKYISDMLEREGLRLFNSSKSIMICDDKMMTFEELSNKGIPMPYTLPGLLCYDEDKEINEEALNEVEKTLSYPLIIKESYGSLGKGVYKANNRKELETIARKLQCKPHLYQRFVKSSEGRDIRVIVIGGKYLTSMVRESSTDFRSNLELGGHGTRYNAPKELIELCEKVANILGLDYCGIDVLFGENGYLICEVNSNAFFGGIESVTDVNVAKAYAEYIYNEIYR